MSVGLEVAGIVFSLISAFRSGIEIVDRVGDRRRRRRRRLGSHHHHHHHHRRNDASSSSSSVAVTPAQRRLDEDEARLSRSLGKAPDQISREYERDLELMGDGFARGDPYDRYMQCIEANADLTRNDSVIARTSLADILLKLNTGLVNIISSFLVSADDKAVLEGHLDYASLIRLSEDSRNEALAALGGLYQRMSTTSLQTIAQPVPRAAQPRTKPKPKSKPRRATGGSSGARIFVIRSNRVELEGNSSRSDVSGAWVKKKPRNKKRTHHNNSTDTSGSSDHIASSGGRSRANKKNASDSSLDVSSPNRTLASASSLVSTASPAQGTSTVKSTSSSPSSKKTRRPSTAPSPEAPAASAPPPLPTPESTPPSSPTTVGRPRRRPLPQDHKALIPVVKPDESSLKPAAPRKCTPSMYSFASASTCLGEIPDNGTVDQRIGNIDEAISWRDMQGTAAAMFCDQALMPAPAASLASPCAPPPPPPAPFKTEYTVEVSEVGVTPFEPTGSVATSATGPAAAGTASGARKGKRKFWGLFLPRRGSSNSTTTVSTAASPSGKEEACSP